MLYVQGTDAWDDTVLMRIFRKHCESYDSAHGTQSKGSKKKKANKQQQQVQTPANTFTTPTPTASSSQTAPASTPNAAPETADAATSTGTANTASALSQKRLHTTTATFPPLPGTAFVTAPITTSTASQHSTPNKKQKTEGSANGMNGHDRTPVQSHVANSPHSTTAHDTTATSTTTNGSAATAQRIPHYHYPPSSTAAPPPPPFTSATAATAPLSAAANGTHDIGSQHAPLCPPMPSAAALGMDDIALQNLLMSWYYAGFYTGHWQAKREAAGQMQQSSASQQPASHTPL